MSCLTVYHQSTADIPNKVLTHADDIAATLAEQGVRFEQWTAAAPLQRESSAQEMIAAYQASIDALMSERGYRHVALISVSDEPPQDTRLLAEHVRDEDEARLFVSGRGQFSLHIGEYVYVLLCEKNDLLVVPAGVAHWFDLGENPRMVAIRMGNNPQAQVRFTGEKIAQRFARLDD